ncbi:conserved hypothetical protein [Theileria orientalis strain Shintoku]|uniref:Phytanoyl-CoA dioxygenase n=1 Tax=Theileria orientalis strain Shintoku TaxID=869250 RepID=J4C2X4_THEOR|nr:conserved hypothetical protein [Theileria orientalis strain Shintoku]BAM39446.1 conserved hypothetical protein [Theileria orientalis strain Shintoku]|eukprot:XP_009689747.1 conserved hypothetical protein [Theileria orientalis strain Shintoku]
MGAPKHPSYSFSLDSKTLFTSEGDEENHDLSGERLWKDTRFINYVKTLSKLINIPKIKIHQLSKNLNPVELQLQTVLEILYYQKAHYTDPLKYSKSIATKRYYIKALGPDLSIEMDKLIDESNTCFEHGKVPEHWMSILPASSIERRHNLEMNFRNLVTRSFKMLYSHWKNMGLISESGDILNEIRPKYNTIAKNSLGKNIGAKSAPYLLFGESSLWSRLKRKLANEHDAFLISRDSDEISYVPNNIPSIKFLYKVKSTLNKYGVAVVRNVFNKEQIREIKNKLHLKSTQARDNVFKIIEMDPNVSTFKFTRAGRINCVLRGTSFNEALSPLQSFWMPFVYYFMKNDRYSMELNKVACRRIFLSNVQLISSDAMSFVEPWHRENKNAGITVVIPLQDTHKSNGRLQFIPGTHVRQAKDQHVYCVGPVGVDLKEGDVLIYNSSILHRNTINESNVCQSMVVFSYDHVDTPPPGQGLLKYIVDNYHGNMIVNLNKLLF